MKPSGRSLALWKLKSKLMMDQIRRILLLHHTHTDIGYTHSQPVVWRLHRQIIDDAISICEQTSNRDDASKVRWTCEVTSTLINWLEQADSEQISRFRSCVDSGQMSAAAFFVNMTPMFGAYEMKYSIRFMRQLKQQLGLPFRMAINHDVNGIPWATVGHLLDAGVDTLLMGLNPHFGGFPLSRPLVFDWEGPDGRKIRTFNAEHYGSFHRWLRPEERSLEIMQEGLARYLKSLFRRIPEYPHDFILLSATHFDFVDNNPPDPRVAEMVEQWNQSSVEPSIEFVHSDQLAEILHSLPDDVIPTERGDWPDYWNFGCASAAREARIQRQTKARLRTIEVLGGPVPDDMEDFHQAWWNALLFDEHTWGSWAPTWNHKADDVPAGIAHKFNFGYEARALTSWVMRRALDHHIGNSQEALVKDIDMTSLAVINAAPLARTVTLTTTTRLQEGRWFHYPSRMHNTDVRAACLGDDEEWEIGPFQVPANGCLLVKCNELQPEADVSECEANDDVLSSPFYRLKFEAESGIITSIVDRETNLELINLQSPYDFFGYVLESVDKSRHQGLPKYHGRDAFFDTDFEQLSVKMIPGWKPEWPANREKPSQANRVKSSICSLGPRLEIDYQDAPGASELRMTITLAADRKAIFFEVEFEKLHSLQPEGVYFTFPLLMKNWRSWYDSSGVTVELDEDQLRGAVRDFQTVETFVAVGSDRHSLVLACPDAPMVQIGDFNFCKCLQRVPRDQNCLLLAWPMNTYWDTNFPASQPGFQRFRYELTTMESWDSRFARNFGITAATPIEIHPVLAGAEEKAQQLLGK